MKPAAVAGRMRALRRLADEHFDLLVVGGGATGAAIARDAALRGLRVALCERGDFAAQTSSQSSKLIHGGIRYLPYLNLRLVHEGLRERRILLQTAPHLCRPIDFVFPTYAGQRPTLAELDVGIALYNAMGLWRQPSAHGRLSATDSWAQFPLLRTAGLRGARTYRDCQTNDARLVIENVIDAISAGATCVSYTEVRAPLETRGGSLQGARITDVLGRHEIEVRARVIINATGPFSDWFRGHITAPGSRPVFPPRLRPTLGVHLVLDAARLPTGGRAIALQTPVDGRLFFVLPAGARTLVGTTDTDFSSPTGGPPAPTDPIAARSSDVDYLLRALAHTFPSAQIQADDIVSTYAGLRPLIAAPEASASATSREHEIFIERPGLMTLAGGKLTTMRSMAQQAVDLGIELLAARGVTPPIGRCTTLQRPLPGAADEGKATDGTVLNMLPRELARHLSARYGTRASAVASIATQSHRLQKRIVPDLPDVLAEVVYAARHENALTPEDVLRRRLAVFHNGWGQGLDALPGVIELMAAELGWNTDDCVHHERRYRAQVSASRAWQMSRAAGATTR